MRQFSFGLLIICLVGWGVARYRAVSRDRCVDNRVLKNRCNGRFLPSRHNVWGHLPERLYHPAVAVPIRKCCCLYLCAYCSSVTAGDFRQADQKVLGAPCRCYWILLYSSGCRIVGIIRIIGWAGFITNQVQISLYPISHTRFNHCPWAYRYKQKMYQIRQSGLPSLLESMNSA